MKQRQKAGRSKQVSGTYEQTLDREITLASERLGKTPTSRLKWLLQFAQSDLDSLSAGRWADVGWEVAAFSLPEKILAGKGGIEEKKNAMVSLVLLVPLSPKPWTVPQEIVRKFHNSIKQGFEAFFGGGWEIERPAIKEKIVYAGGQTRIRSGVFPGAITVLSLRAFDTISAEIQRIGKCESPRCGRPFVADKKGRGRFCSPRCSAYVRIARFRKKA